MLVQSLLGWLVMVIAAIFALRAAYFVFFDP